MIRILPVAVRPVDGETPNSYLDRLARANYLQAETLWGRIRELRPALPTKRDLELATIELENLGGLEPNWFATNRAHHLLPIRCPHHNWKFRVCTTCSRPPTPQSGCLRCSGGDQTEVRTRTGPICLHHARWHYQGADIDVSKFPKHLVAERIVRFELSNRGVGLETGEIQLAATLVGDLTDPTPQPPLDRAGMNPPGGGQTTALIARFPEIVRLTATLTDRDFANYLLGIRWSPTQHGLLIAEAVEEATGRPLSDQTQSDVWTVMRSNRRAMAAAHGMVGRNRSSRRCNVQRALCAAAYTHRACLLRHLDAKTLPPSGETISQKPAPSVMRTVRYQQNAYPGVRVAQA